MSLATVSYSDLVPDDLQARFMVMAESIEEREWEIGRLAADLCDEWEAHGISKMKVCEAVAVFCKARPGTIRDYEYTARNVPRRVVEAYPELGRSHFRELIPYVHTLTDWSVLIDRWKEGAKTLSVRSLQAHLARKDGAPPKWEGRLAKARESCVLLAEDDEAPPPVRSAARRFLTSTE